MKANRDDRRWLRAAAALAVRARPISCPNPAVGAIIVKDGIVAGRGWTAAGGRPHAEAIALEKAGDAARGATLYVTLEPCAHESVRGPDCAGLVAESGIAEVVIGIGDPDPRTAGRGIAKLQAAGIEARLSDDPACRESLAGYLARTTLGRPHITLKLATSLDGRIALADGASRWITGEVARAHAHLERARSDAILVGAGTLRTDNPKLDVRLPGLESRSPRRCVLTRGEAPQGWTAIASPQAVHDLPEVQYLLVEGGAETAAGFIAADLVDRLLIYRAPILIGGGKPCLGDIGIASLDEVHNRWRREATKALGTDTLEILTRIR